MKLKYISWVPAVVIMAVIFYFSSKPADTSSESSLAVVNQMISIFENITDVEYQKDDLTELKENLNHIVRKTAHFCEYAVLACTFAFSLTAWKKRGKWLFLIPVLLSALYAATDEFHQTFVPGRAGMIRDVLLDSSGAAAGSLLFCLITAAIIKKVKKRNGLVLS
jgi:VanZ family protein